MDYYQLRVQNSAEHQNTFFLLKTQAPEFTWLWERGGKWEKLSFNEETIMIACSHPETGWIELMEMLEIVKIYKQECFFDSLTRDI